MNLVVKIAAGIVLAFVLLVAGCGVLVASSTSGDLDTPTADAIASSSDTSEPTGDDSSGETSGQENARQTAESYLEHQSFSRKGLLEQLSYEGYSAADAAYAVDAISPDWNEQAAKSATSYLEHQSFSRSSLHEQLVYEGFTATQAAYGVNAAY